MRAEAGTGSTKHEATQSQQVRREQGKVKEEGGSKKKKALILFEDIDLVFDDLDDGFYGAVTTLVQQTKRPIVLTTSDPGFKIFGHRALRCDPEVIICKRSGQQSPGACSGGRVQLVQPQLCQDQGWNRVLVSLNFLARTTFVLVSLSEVKIPGQDATFGDFVFNSSKMQERGGKG